MPVVVSCRCRNTYTLKDEYAGKLVECPQCGAVNKAGESSLTPKSQADPVFNRDIFLLRQKVAINQKYQVSDEEGNALIYVERPTYFFWTLLAIVGAAIVTFVLLTAAMVLVGVVVGVTQGPNASPPGDLPAKIASIFTPVVFVVIAMAFSKKRHVTFYRDESRTEKMSEVLQDKKVQFPIRTYSV